MLIFFCIFSYFKYKIIVLALYYIYFQICSNVKLKKSVTKGAKAELRTYGWTMPSLYQFSLKSGQGQP